MNSSSLVVVDYASLTGYKTMAEFSPDQKSKIDAFFTKYGISKLCKDCNGKEKAVILPREIIIANCLSPETKEINSDYQLRSLMLSCNYCGKQYFYPEQAII